ncbi:histone-lysine N-methyltransferase SETDB2 isoform X1 [Dunckerocampus dactyliophorus]|uniref:histone-lysine N-methyltransferase SETDB2 isoform X1 n=1 Tax=Dunckerocampus dactyliophorus TaxID=161453 RepID=UPI0024072D51|nr:histone-lysine N-methyltransferase SETDB2 isoform X1 [Dunckerocampus dactyliophorus]
MDDSFDHQDVDRAKTFWAKENVDQVFSVLYKHLDHLREVLKTNTATDKERVQALKLFDCMDWTVLSPSSDTPVVRVVVGADDVLQDELCQHSPTYTPPQSAASPAGSEELLCPLVPIQLQYRLHVCCKTCLPTLPDMHQSTPPFWAQNPLKVPLLCHFKRMMAMPLMLSKGGSANNHQQTGAFEEEEDEDHCDVIYKAPCGQSLRNYDDVMRFLFATDSYDVLQLDYFSFNMAVQLDPPAAQGPWLPEIDLSRGTEPTPVELCVGPDDTRPAEFRYRKDRWPHGCFLSRDPLFDACCDCTDGCLDAQHCACIAMTGAGHHYTHQRLTKPLPSGLFECGPWCSCDRARCQNRIVQRGIKVRLQVFWTDRCGWGVRCLDDLDAGMFVCIFAGVILQRVQKPNEPPPPKLTRVDLPSDDEVEVVTEWLALPVLEGSNLEAPEPTSPPLHVPVIQRPTEVNAHQDEDKAKKVDMMTANADGSGNKTDSQKSLKRVVNPGDVYLLDARKEGNVSRFFNHSCQPNLFIQNVFTDSHDPDFPITAFFTNSVVKAGTELTWNYSLNTHVSPKQQQEVVCVCGSDDCLGKFMTENLCKTCGFGSGDACEST